MQIERLLYVVGVTEPKFSEVQRVLELRTLGLEEIVFLHAAKVEGWETRLAEYGITSRTIPMKGRMARGILDVANREKVSLIAASVNRDISGRARRSLTKGLLRSSPVPVMILPENIEVSDSAQKGIFTQVIFPDDWSVASEKARNYLLNFKEIIKELEIVYVLDRKLSIRDMGNLKEKLSQTRKIFLGQGIDAEAHVYAGEPADEVMLAAQDYGATCIVMGTTGKSPLKELLSKGYSYRVAEASVVPTLVIP
ncbi:MAG: universal stress protein [Thermodesulfobacteriota bacterium]|nr:universal stress protein [Thermodesulfobacteriota bacterium]